MFAVGVCKSCSQPLKNVMKISPSPLMVPKQKQPGTNASGRSLWPLAGPGLSPIGKLEFCLRGGSTMTRTKRDNLVLMANRPIIPMNNQGR